MPEQEGLYIPAGSHLVTIFDSSGNLLFSGSTKLTGQDLQDFANQLATNELLAEEGLQTLVGDYSGDNNPYSPAGSGSDLSEWLNQAKDWAQLHSEGDFLDPTPPQPPLTPQLDLRPSNKPINKNPISTSTAGPPGDPCGNSSQILQNSQIPRRNGDPDIDSQLVGNLGNGYTGSQQQGLMVERVLADIAGNYQDWSGSGSDLETTIKDAIAAIPPTATPSEVAADIIAAILQPILGLQPNQLGTLSPALISTLDNLEQELKANPNDPNIDWSALGDYLSAQADADAAAMQANFLDPNGTGKSPCSNINNALQNAKTQEKNSQQAANDALKKLNLSPTGHYLTGPPTTPLRSVPTGPTARVTTSRPSGGPTSTRSSAHVSKSMSTAATTATRGNIAQRPLGQINKGFLQPSGPLISTGPMVSDVTRTQRPHLDLRSFGQVMDSVAQSQGFVGTLRPTPLPDWLGESQQAQDLVDFMNSSLTKILDVITVILGSFVSTDPDPDYHTKMTAGVQLDGETQVVENKLGVLLAFRQKYPNPPPKSNPTALTNYNKLMAQLINLEEWYHLQYGEYWGNYP